MKQRPKFKKSVGYIEVDANNHWRCKPEAYWNTGPLPQGVFEKVCILRAAYANDDNWVLIENIGQYFPPHWGNYNNDWGYFLLER